MKEMQQDPAKNAQERPESHQRAPKRSFWGPKTKTIHDIPKTILQVVGVGGLAEAGGGERGGKLPEFGGSSGFAKRYL